jgi:cytochrome d ubiquinol oxidase subunit I
MEQSRAIHRLHFAFTVTYHYLFPQLTMGLALLIFFLKTWSLRGGGSHAAKAAHFWTRIFALNFVMGVVTGIPLEFQFGTSWSQFSERTGSIVGQPLAMEGVFAFFLESTVLGLFLYGKHLMGPALHWLCSLLLLLGTWLSGYFIIVTNAWMQHPVGYRITEEGVFVLEDLRAILLNPWALWQYAHTMVGSVVTASFVMASIGAYYLLARRAEEFGRTFVRLGVAVGLLAAVLQLFPTGDGHGKMVARHQPVTLAAMEGLFKTEASAPLVLVGQPDVPNRKLDNPLAIPGMLSFLTYQRWGAVVDGLDAFPEEDWPDNIPLLYYSYHIMVGLGTLFITILSLCSLQLIRGKLLTSRSLLWVLLLSLPFPYIANTAGWMTAELGRQPWLVYGLMRTSEGVSPAVSAGNALFTLLGFMGLYALLSVLFLFLVQREIARGPAEEATHA